MPTILDHHLFAAGMQQDGQRMCFAICKLQEIVAVADKRECVKSNLEEGGILAGWRLISRLLWRLRAACFFMCACGCACMSESGGCCWGQEGHSLCGAFPRDSFVLLKVLEASLAILIVPILLPFVSFSRPAIRNVCLESICFLMLQYGIM